MIGDTMTAEKIGALSRELGGDGIVSLSFSYSHPRAQASWPSALTRTTSQQQWRAVTTVARPRKRGRYVTAYGADPSAALRELLRAMP